MIEKTLVETIEQALKVHQALMNTEREEQQGSNLEIQLVLNDRCYKGHFKSIENVKRVLSET